MSELRQNPFTKEWVIIARDRARRPDEFRSRREPPERPASDPSCPFCPGNEASTPPEVAAFRVGSPNAPGWWVRVVPNRFPALAPEASGDRSGDHYFRRMAGVGRHEVIIEAPAHNLPFALLSDHQAEAAVLMYRDRYLALQKDRAVKAVILFKNYGEAAGTSLVHPHAQIVGTPIVPEHLRAQYTVATQYYDDTGGCIYCDVVKEERKAKERVVFEGEGFVAFHPFASRSPFETWIAPTHHVPSFGQISTDEAKRFARVLAAVLSKISRHLNDPDYNFVVHSAPLEDENKPYFLWHLCIIPRLTTVAGFEIGSGIFINTAVPEETAAYMNERD
jgi:UDPglucose--hexose-1-phosphate uridylyltransferase